MNLQRRRLLLGQSALAYIFRDLFTTTKAAPLGATRVCEPGPGTLSIADTNSIMSIVNGALAVNGTPAAGNNIATPTALTRFCGRTLFASFPTHGNPGTGGNPRVGLVATINGNEDIGVDFASDIAFRIKTGTTVIDTVTYSAGQWDFAFVMRNTGGYLFARDGTSGPYTLIWLYFNSTSTQFPNIYLNNAASVNFTADNLAVLDLPAPFDTDFGFATFRDTSFVAGTTRAGLVSFVMEINLVLSGSPNFALKFRRLDTNNAWIFQITGTSGRLDEYNAAVITNRAVHNAGYVDGTYRIILTIDGSAMKIYRNNVLSMSYTDVNNKFPGMSDVEYTTIGAGVTFSDLTMYPRTYALPSV